jgi:hypothetical protein
MKNILSSKYAILLILAVALMLRTIFLNEAPLGLSNDELSFIVNAKSISLTGRDILGSWQPWSLQPIYNTFPMSELSFLIAIPLINIFRITLLTAKLPYALFSVLLVGILYLIVNKLFGKKEALIVGIVAAISPWGIFLGRTAFDSPIAVCYYMLALAILLYSKSWKILLSLIPLFLAFYSYIGTKIIFLPFALFVIFFSWYVLNNKRYTKYYLILAAACLSLFAFFLLSLNSGNTGKRLSEIITPSSQIIIDKVNYERKLSIDSPIIPLVVNKYTVFTKVFFSKYVGILSPQYQFINGDGNMHLSLWEHGYLYYLDFVFLLLGFHYLLQKNKKASVLLIGLMLIVPLPAALNASEGGYAYRGALIYPLFIILIGIGISHLTSAPKQLLLKRLLAGLIIISYTALLINFLAIYFLRYPIYNSEGPNFSTRILSKYITLANTQNKLVYVHSQEPDALYRGYVLYANSYNKNSARAITKNFVDKTYALNNVKFSGDCPDKQEVKSDNIVIINYNMRCNGIEDYKNMRTSTNIEQLSDGGTLFSIYKDSVCNNYSLSRYPNNFKFFDFNIEKLSMENFCTKYIFDKK